MKESLALFDKNKTQIGTVNKDNFSQQKEKGKQKPAEKKPLKKKKSENLEIKKQK